MAKKPTRASKPVVAPNESRLRKALWHLAEMLKVIRLLRAPLLASIAAGVMFYLPDQTRELYRITAAEGNWLEISVGICALVAMFWVFWWVSFEIGQRFSSRIDKTAGLARWLLRKLPAAIAALPLFLCAGGLWQAQALGEYDAPDAASPWYGKAKELEEAVDGLENAAFALACLGGVLFVAAYWLQQNRKIDLEAEGRRSGFFSAIGLGMSVTIFFGIATAVLLFPVTVPQAIGTLPLLALFFLALVLVLAHSTFWHEMTGVPFLAFLVLMALVFAAFNLNDNHDIASVEQKFGATAAAKNQIPGDAWASFLAWYQARPGKDKFKDTYPVYVVAAKAAESMPLTTPRYCFRASRTIARNFAIMFSLSVVCPAVV